MNKPLIGFIGVGLMGAGMAKNIVTKGYPLVIMGHHNREPSNASNNWGRPKPPLPGKSQCGAISCCCA